MMLKNGVAGSRELMVNWRLGVSILDAVEAPAALLPSAIAPLGIPYTH